MLTTVTKSRHYNTVCVRPSLSAATQQLYCRAACGIPAPLNKGGNEYFLITASLENQ